MNALELMERIGGEVLGHKIRAVINGEIVVIARMEDTDWALTEQGQTLANQHSNEVAAEADAPKTRRSRKAEVVEASETTTTDSAAVELTEVAPEQ